MYCICAGATVWSLTSKLLQCTSPASSGMGKDEFFWGSVKSSVFSFPYFVLHQSPVGCSSFSDTSSVLRLNTFSLKCNGRHKNILYNLLLCAVRTIHTLCSYPCFNVRTNPRKIARLCTKMQFSNVSTKHSFILLLLWKCSYGNLRQKQRRNRQNQIFNSLNVTKSLGLPTVEQRTAESD